MGKAYFKLKYISQRLSKSPSSHTSLPPPLPLLKLGSATEVEWKESGACKEGEGARVGSECPGLREDGP